MNYSGPSFWQIEKMRWEWFFHHPGIDLIIFAVLAACAGMSFLAQNDWRWR